MSLSFLSGDSLFDACVRTPLWQCSGAAMRVTGVTAELPAGQSRGGSRSRE